MEQTTPLFLWLKQLQNPAVVGSEYFGDRFESGEEIGPFGYQARFNFRKPLRSVIHNLSLSYTMFRLSKLRHEDVTSLSFQDSTCDLIVSNDVFEHIHQPMAAFRECARVLRPDGVMLATFPFLSNELASVTRAKRSDTGIENLLPEEFHGDPISNKGSLVFTDFGWDVLERFREAGFKDAVLEVYRKVDYGHLGAGLLVFRLTR